MARESNRVSHKMRGGYWLLNKNKPPNRCLKHRWWNHTGRKANSENGYASRTKRQVLGRRGGGVLRRRRKQQREERLRRVNNEGIIVIGLVTSPTWHLGQKGVDVNAAHGTHAQPTITDIEHQLWGWREAEAGRDSKGTGVCSPRRSTHARQKKNLPARKGHPPLQGPWGGCASGWGCSW